ncbi:hypothetical protein IHQ71_14710 [Rhizobium sp. TH2]|uniref:hypothetical protein n=1 Tax=Rhizobium sp. TH2 TaxID=2775403 RepID=UPI0021574018|nr:hypothetical protein [Rhizobium sp. TH2]UVC06525.1 hypothetical protein IHQ71_14710 [Rhizobium sp. TH2]
MRRLPAAAITLLFLTAPTFAQAHGTEGGLVLLLPTGYYLLGAGLAVAASFLLLAFVTAQETERVAAMRLRLFTVPDVPREITSAIGFFFLAFLVFAGIVGSRDPVVNPLPTMIWTIWWVCFTLFQAVVGPLWHHFNPWTAILALFGRNNREGLLKLPVRAGYRIAVLQFAVFAWFELIYVAPSDPLRLAIAVIAFWAFNLAGAFIFGEKDWMARAEPFSIFFGLIGRLSPFHREPIGEKRTGVVLTWPGMTLISANALPLTGVFFILLTLSTVSFDGLSRTFLWLGSIHVNPLEFPGRSDVETSGTSGLIGMFAAMSALYLGTVALGCRLAGRSDIWLAASGRLIYSLVPIALAFQAAHYLTSVLVDGQNALIALSDPYSLGWNLFGTAGWHTTTSFLNTMSGVSLIFNTQTLVIALGHITGIVMAHLIALRIFDTPRQAVASQIPLAALMVFYTAFGLWLLATPRI